MKPALSLWFMFPFTTVAPWQPLELSTEARVWERPTEVMRQWKWQIFQINGNLNNLQRRLVFIWIVILLEVFGKLARLLSKTPVTSHCANERDWVAPIKAITQARCSFRPVASEIWIHELIRLCVLSGLVLLCRCTCLALVKSLREAEEFHDCRPQEFSPGWCRSAKNLR